MPKPLRIEPRSALTSRHGVRRVLAPYFVALLLASPFAHAAQNEADRSPFLAGRPLAEALRALEPLGLRIVFSSLSVPPELPVVATPAVSEPRLILDALLAPHALRATPGAGGSLIVERDGAAPPEPSDLAGALRDALTRAPVAGAELLLVEGERRATSDADGRFSFDALSPGLYSLDVRHPRYVVERFEGLPARPGETTELLLRLQPAPLASDAIVVQPSRATLLGPERVAAVALGRDEIAALPKLGDDVLRSLELLPGVASNDLTAQFHVRGGRRDELLFRLDGQEIYDGFHLRDFDGALSMIAASSLAGVTLTTGSFPADAGDRMGGVLELESAAAFESGRARVGFGALTLEAGLARPFAGERGRLLVQARTGTSKLVESIFDRDQPEFWDLFGRLDFETAPGRSLRLHLLHADDRFELVEGGDEEPKRLRTEYDSSYLWLTHQALFGPRLYVDTALSHAASDRDRRDVERDSEKDLAVADLRDNRVDELRQSWGFEPTPRRFARFGFGWRRFRSSYDYQSLRFFDTPLALLRPEPREGLFRFVDAIDERRFEAYYADRIRPHERLTLELGARYDRGSAAGGAWSPRLTAAFALGERSLVRAGWGRFRQSHRTYELMIEDGDSRRYPDERSEQSTLGFERRWSSRSRFGLDALRIEAYARSIDSPRPRYESLLEPFDPFPEGELDRYRFAPEKSRVRGIELFARGRLGERLDGWVNVTRQTSEDFEDGGWRPRSIDQRWAVNLSLGWRPAPDWSVSAAWLFHTGRPTTAIDVEHLPPPDDCDGEDDDEGEAEPEPLTDCDDFDLVRPVLGPINGERLASSSRVDLRIARRVERPRARITLYGDVQNLLDHANQAGVDVEYDDETGELVRQVERWPGFVASAGVVFAF